MDPRRNDRARGAMRSESAWARLRCSAKTPPKRRESKTPAPDCKMDRMRRKPLKKRHKGDETRILAQKPSFGGTNAVFEGEKCI